MYFDPAGKDERSCLKEMVHGYNVSCAISVAVKLGLAERLEDGPQDAEQLAEALEVNADALKRVMRLLMNVGILTGEPDGRFALASRGQYLRRAHPASIASEVLLFAGDETYLAWSQLLHSVRTGEPGFKQHFGKPIFEYLGEHPSSNARFHAGWKEITTQVGREMAAQYDFSQADLVMDIGGGSGVLTAAVLKAHPHLKGSIYDLHFSMESAKKTLEAYRVEDRCEIIPGDAMQSVPEGADLQLLKSVLHNCPDVDAVTILRNSASALKPGGKVLVLERVIEKEGAYVWGNVVDVAMLIMTGGRERTLEHYRELYAQAGLKLTRCIGLPSGFSIIEGELAD